jgi:hypothetical protein
MIVVSYNGHLSAFGAFSMATRSDAGSGYKFVFGRVNAYRFEALGDLF